MRWELTQSGSQFSGMFTMRDADTGVNGQGSVTGTATASSITFSLTVGAGGFEPPFATCTSTVSGTANVSSTVLDGTYTGTNSCTGTVSSGQLTLNRQ